MKPRPPLELTIGSLVLNGFEARGRHACARAFTTEFERLVLERGFPQLSKSTPSEWRLPVLRIAANSTDSPSQWGRALARGLFDAFTRAADNP